LIANISQEYISQKPNRAWKMFNISGYQVKANGYFLKACRRLQMDIPGREDLFLAFSNILNLWRNPAWSPQTLRKLMCWTNLVLGFSWSRRHIHFIQIHVTTTCSNHNSIKASCILTNCEDQHKFPKMLWLYMAWVWGEGRGRDISYWLGPSEIFVCCNIMPNGDAQLHPHPDFRAQNFRKFWKVLVARLWLPLGTELSSCL
jgi:hypothetical protein